MRLGRKARKTDTRTLRLAKYLAAALPPAPESVDWTRGIADFGVMLNDRLGDCTCAGVAHQVQLWTANTGTEATITEDQVLGIYESWCGYDPSDPSTDAGGVELDILNDWKRQGFAGHALLAYADAAVDNATEIRQAVALFGGLYIGMQVPNNVMQSDLDPAVVWDAAEDDGGIDGGHCVVVCGYDAETLHFISWGKVYRMTPAFWAKYVDEAHALLSPDWIAANGSPSGFNLGELQADLARIR